MGSPKKHASPANRPLPSSLAPTDARSEASVIDSNSAKVSDDKISKREVPDKSTLPPYPWQKGYKAAWAAYYEAVANNSKELKVVVSDAEFPSAVAANQNDNPVGPSIGVHNLPAVQNGQAVSPQVDALDLAGYHKPSTENFGDYKEADFDWESSEEDEADMAISGKKTRGKSSKKKRPDPNGRRVGRKLVMWHRPRMMEKLLLHVQYECHRRGVIIPWGKVVKRLSPGSSGFAALQHLNKLRDVLVSEGHMVPPLLGKRNVKQDPTIRGHLRDMSADSPIATRIVRWGEAIEDRKENLVVPGINRGSGNYPRGGGTGLPNTIQSATKPTEGARRCRMTVEEIAAKNTPTTPVIKERKKPGPKPGSKNKPKAPKAPVPARSPSLDPAELASDDSYTPNVKFKAKGKYSLRKVPEKNLEEIDEGDSDATIEDDGVPVSSPTPIVRRRKSNDAPVTPPATLSLKLSLGSELLENFPAGESKPVAIHKSDDGEDDVYAEGSASDDESDEYRDDDAVDSDEEFGDEPMPREMTTYEELVAAQYAPSAVERIMAARTGGQYLGVLTHGTHAEYENALRSGIDPRYNGLNYKRARLNARAATESAEQFLANGPDHVLRSIESPSSDIQHHADTDMMNGYNSTASAPHVYGNYENHTATYHSDVDTSMEDRRQSQNAFFDSILGQFVCNDEVANSSTQYATDQYEVRDVTANDMVNGAYQNHMDAFSGYQAGSSYVGDVAGDFTANNMVNDSYQNHMGVFSGHQADSSYVDGIGGAPGFNIHVDNYSHQGNDAPSGYDSAMFGSSDHSSLGMFNWADDEYQVVYDGFGAVENDENAYPHDSGDDFIPEYFGEQPP